MNSEANKYIFSVFIQLSLMGEVDARREVSWMRKGCPGFMIKNGASGNVILSYAPLAIYSYSSS